MMISGPRTSLHIFDRIHNKKLQYNFPKMRGGRRPFGIFPKIHPIWRSHPSLGTNCNYSIEIIDVIFNWFHAKICLLVQT